jgi:sugar/nucleoside kinase (ribokinase family)
MQVVDTTGAGDCFTGAYAVAVLEQQAPQAALRFAGAAVLQHPTGLFGSHARLLLLLLHSARVSVMCATGRSSTSCCMLESVYSLLKLIHWQTGCWHNQRGGLIMGRAPAAAAGALCVQAAGAMPSMPDRQRVERLLQQAP